MKRYLLNKIARALWWAHLWFAVKAGQEAARQQFTNEARGRYEHHRHTWRGHRLDSKRPWLITNGSGHVEHSRTHRRSTDAPCS